MKRLLVAIPVALMLCGPGAMAAPAGGAPSPPVAGGSGSGGANDHGQQERKQHALFAVLQQAKTIRTADGGTLTDAHRAELQRRLDAVRAGNY